MNAEDSDTGLSSTAAAKRLATEGYNELPASGGRSIFEIARSVAGEPMFGLLLAAAGVYLVIGDLREAAVLSFFALLSVAIVIVQEWRSERVLDALRDLTSPRALVIRDGDARRIPGREVVRDDLLILAEGDRIPADACLLGGDELLIDESLLTGESVHVRKTAQAGMNSLFAGTLVVRGGGRARVTATGIFSEIGKIGKSLEALETEPPRLQQQTKKIVLVFASLSLCLSLLSIGLYGWLRHDWLEALLSGIALGMSLLPEEFPLVLTVFMVMGAWRISRANVLTRRSSAIETLGSATVLCTDKTGTLTMNRMTIVHLQTSSTVWKSGDRGADEDILSLLRAGLKASRPESRDPMDIAFSEHPLLKEKKGANESAIFHYGICPGLPMMARVFRKAGGLTEVYAKGAPETIAAACGFSPEQLDELHRDVGALARKGLRLLAIAVAEIEEPKNLPQHANGFSYRFLGLAGFSDPLREHVPTAVENCYAAGIRIIMMTGDYPVTASAIAQQAGIRGEAVMTGEALASMGDKDFRAAIASTNIFARITHDQKLRIVSALKDEGEIVAMTGDGVNDAPSLKAAHIGVAMGQRGTDVAREASALVLLDDNFSSLVTAIALGRRIYDNLRKAMTYIVAVHVPIAGLALLPLLLDQPLLLTPLLIALIEMVIDPACSIVLEAERGERNVMKRPPRAPTSPLLPAAALLWGFVQGIVAVAVLGSLWLLAFEKDMPEDETRSLVFVSLMLINLVLIIVNRSFSSSLRIAVGRRNPFLGWGVLGIGGLFALLLSLPVSKDLFGFGVLHLHDLAYAGVAGLILLFSLEAIKPEFQRRIEPSS